jgi:hypothetical protein
MSSKDPVPLLPSLARHVHLNRQGEVIKARLCHNLFALEYDRNEIRKVPYNRQYRREKLVLIDGPLNKVQVLRESLSTQQRKTMETNAEVARSIARIKEIYGKGKAYELDSQFDKAKKSKCLSILASLPKTHSLLKKRNIVKIMKTGKGDTDVTEELLQHEMNVTDVRHLDRWEEQYK